MRRHWSSGTRRGENWFIARATAYSSRPNPRPCGCRKTHPAHRQGTMYQKKRRYLPSDLRPAFGSTCGETRSRWKPRNPGQQSNWGFRHPQAHAAGLVALGLRLGLYRAMAGQGPLTSNEAAERAGLDERWVREWLHAQSAARVVDYAGDGRFEVTDAVAALLADESSILY